MKFIILSLVISFSCASVAVAQARKETKQPKCDLGLERVPELRGLRIGASQASVLARFPGTSVEKPDKFGVTQLRLTVIASGAIVKGLPSRDKAVQPDITSTPGEESAFTIDAARFPALKEVRRIRLRFIDGRLSYVQVAYDDSINWDNVDEFAETAAKALNLPADWDLPADSDGSTKVRELRCQAFAITADVGADPGDSRIAAQLSVEDLAASKTLEKRQNDVKEKAERAQDAKRKNFKP